MLFLNYNKDEKLEFNYKRACGLWLIVVAVIISLATLIGGKQIINMQVFCIGYVISFFSINMNKKVLNKLSNGSSSKFQDKVSQYAIILLFVLMVFLGGPFFATENWRLIWLGALMATALHFFPYYFVHGKSMIYLGIICTINIAVAYIFTDISLVLVAYIDAAIKFVFGVYLLFFSKPELIDLVFTLYQYRMKREHLIKPKLLKNIKIKGKNIESQIDIYIEFVQMNNLERTVIKTIDKKTVTVDDVWQFDNILKDLKFFPKGVLYYNSKIDEKALELANNKHIQVIYFDFMKETIKNALNTLEQVLPDKDVIGDPFWTLMQVDERTKNNTGNYLIIENSLPLFTSKKLADACCKKQNGYAVFGVSQSHLAILLSLAEKGMLPHKFGIIQPSKQISSIIDCNYKVDSKNYDVIREVYVR